MSRDIKYIGMDVHQEAIVIAVLDGSGKLVMESIVETKASSILQFIHGLRGELHVTWEEGPGHLGSTICWATPGDASAGLRSVMQCRIKRKATRATRSMPWKLADLVTHGNAAPG